MAELEQQAIEYFQQAIDKDFNIALGGLGISDSYRNYLHKKKSYYELAIKSISENGETEHCETEH